MPFLTPQPEYIGKHAGERRRRNYHTGFISLLLIILIPVCLLLWGFIEPYCLTLTEDSVSVDGMPSGLTKLRIVYVSDVHAGGFLSDMRTGSIVRMINSCNADLVLFGGDYASDPEGTLAFFQGLPRINSRYGVFAVAGEKDTAGTTLELSRLRNAMTRAGVQLLDNESARVRVDGQDIYIVGLSEYTQGRAEITRLAGLSDASNLVILLCHNPNAIPSALVARDMNYQSNWFDLGLFGHTLGGKIPLLEQLFDSNGVPNRYESGWLRENGTLLLVSRGAGTTGFPYRWGCMPQVHLITLN